MKDLDVGFICGAIFGATLVFGILGLIATVDAKPTEGYNITSFCAIQEIHSNFTERIWMKYCIDPQGEDDYNGTGLI